MTGLMIVSLHQLLFLRVRSHGGFMAQGPVNLSVMWALSPKAHHRPTYPHLGHGIGMCSGHCLNGVDLLPSAFSQKLSLGGLD